MTNLIASLIVLWTTNNVEINAFSKNWEIRVVEKATAAIIKYENVAYTNVLKLEYKLLPGLMEKPLFMTNWVNSIFWK